MGVAVTLAGWVAAGLATTGVVVACRSLEERTAAVARACHELRGPLTAARLGLQLGLSGGELSPARLRALDLELGRAGLALEDLTDLRGTRPALRPGHGESDVDVVDLLASSVDAWQASAQARGVLLRLRCSGASPRVRGQRLRLAQATGNLIANAIEHGGGVVEVSERVETATVRIEVADRGPGLPAPLSALVGRRRSSRGARGHGLPVASRVAQQHGGRLASVPTARGARLVLELPARGSAAP